MFCMTCGASNDEDSQFCNTCGSSLRVGDRAADSPLPPNQPTEHEIQTQESTATSETTYATPRPVSRRTTLIWCGVAAAVIVLLAAFGTLQHTVFSPMRPIRAYVSAIAQGDYARANQMTDPGVPTRSRVLLTNAFAKNTQAMQNVSIGSLHNNQDGTQSATISYTIDGNKESMPVSVEKGAPQWLLFNSWHIKPLVDDLHIAVPASSRIVTVNGTRVDLDAHGLEKQQVSTPTDDDDNASGTLYRYSLPTYPGNFNISLADSTYVTSDPITINTLKETAYIRPKATGALRSGIMQQVTKHLSECTSSQSPSKSGCDFLNGDLSTSYASLANIRRTVMTQPTLDTFDLYAGTFETSQIDVSITYQERYAADDSWDDEVDHVSGTIQGSFTLKNGDIDVSFDNPASQQ